MIVCGHSLLHNVIKGFWAGDNTFLNFGTPVGEHSLAARTLNPLQRIKSSDTTRTVDRTSIHYVYLNL